MSDSGLFKIGDVVTVTENVTIDYKDCDIKGIYKIPAGSVGTIISRRNNFNLSLGYKYAVRFSDIANYPDLFFDGSAIGPGHYISEKKLRAAQWKPPKNERLTAATDNELRNFLFS